MDTNRAVFVDRDGVINELIYFSDVGRVDTPLNPKQFRLLPNVIAGIRKVRAAGYKVILVSNQPGIGKKQFSYRVFQLIRAKMHRQLARGGVSLDGEYYCFHHPNAKLEAYRKVCECRKPKPGLILKAARENDVSLAASYIVGDDISDVRAGKSAGCKTVFVGHVNSLVLELMESKGAYPDYLAPDFFGAAEEIISRRNDLKLQR